MKKRILAIAVMTALIISASGCKPWSDPTDPCETTTGTVPSDLTDPPTAPQTTPDPTEPTDPTKPSETDPTEPVATEPTTQPTDPTEPTEQPPYDPDATDPNNHTHNYAPVEFQNATCQEEGYAVYACTGCEEAFRSTLGIVPHDYILTSETAATPTTAGTMTFSCTYCGDSYTVEIPSDAPNE